METSSCTSSKTTAKTEDEEAERMALIEAALYAAGRPLTLKDLCSAAGLRSRRKVRQLIARLIKFYEEKGGAVEIRELPDGRYVMQVKPTYFRVVRRFASKPLLSDGALKTLAYVAYCQPVEQKEVAKARGTQAYRHLKLLENMGLISRERKGKTAIITTTPYFSDLFGLSHNPDKVRSQLRKVFNEMKIREIGE